MVGTKTTHPVDGELKNNSSKDGELNGRHENNSPKGWRAKKNSPKDGELNGRHENNSPKGWRAQK